MSNTAPWHGPYFVVLASDKAGTSALRKRVRPAHRAWLRAPGGHGVIVRLGGPTLDLEGSMNGTMLVVQAENFKAVEDFVAGDPYSQHGLFERVEIRPWQWSMGQPEDGYRGSVVTAEFPCR